MEFVMKYIDVLSVNVDTFKDYRHESPLPEGVSWSGIEEIQFSDIFIKQLDTNEVREGPSDHNHISSLKDDFENRGWRMDAPMMLVKEIDSTEEKTNEKCQFYKWELSGGHHRIAALKQLGFVKFPFGVIVVKKTKNYSKQSVSLTAGIKPNIEHSPSKKATANDVAKVVAKIISNGDFDNSDGSLNLDKIRDYVTKDLLYTKHTKTVSNIIRKAIAATDRREIDIFTNEEYKERLEKNNHPLANKLSTGKIDKDDWLLGKDSPDRSYIRWCRQHNKMGKRQKIYINVPDFSLTTESELIQARISIIKNIDECFDMCCDVHGGDKKVKNKIYEIVGFTPQTKDELGSGRLIIPVKEATKVKASKVSSTQISIQYNEGNKVKSNKLNKVLGLE